jgi:hypothetical protein
MRSQFGQNGANHTEALKMTRSQSKMSSDPVCENSRHLMKVCPSGKSGEGNVTQKRSE